MKHVLQISWPLLNVDGTLIITLDEKSIGMDLESKSDTKWYVEMTAAPEVDLPYVNTVSARIDCRFEGMDYNVEAGKGNFEKTDRNAFRINSDENRISLDFSGRN